jgi:hypothetical protein
MPGFFRSGIRSVTAVLRTRPVCMRVAGGMMSLHFLWLQNSLTG